MRFSIISKMLWSPLRLMSCSVSVLIIEGLLLIVPTGKSEHIVTLLKLLRMCSHIALVVFRIEFPAIRFTFSLTFIHSEMNHLAVSCCTATEKAISQRLAILFIIKHHH